MKKSRVKKSAFMTSAAVFALLSTVSLDRNSIQGVSAIKQTSKLNNKTSTSLTSLLSADS